MQTERRFSHAGFHVLRKPTGGLIPYVMSFMASRESAVDDETSLYDDDLMSARIL